MDIRCRIEMLGELRVIQGEQTHTRFRTHKAASLLAYLALHMQQTHPRERLLDLLWPDMELTPARLNLNTTLSQLRRQLEPAGIPAGSLLVADKHTLRLNAAAVSADVADFDRLLKQARHQEKGERRKEKEGQGEESGEDDTEHNRTEQNSTEEKQQQQAEVAALLEQAIGLYRGPLLPGWYEEWVTPEQTRCQSAYLDALRQITRLWEAGGQYASALTMAQRLTDTDPYDESGWQAQMRLLVRLRQPGAALETYARLEGLWERELGTRPSAGSRQMADMIRTDPRSALLLKAEAARVAAPAAAPPKAAMPTAGSAANTAAAKAAPAILPTAAPPLPLHLTRFFGREAECGQAVDLLQTPGMRLLTVLGPGGAGKTRFALEVAARVASAFAHRVWFVALADVPDAALIVSALAHALRLPPTAQGDPLDQILAHLGQTPALLVLDNLEQLLRETPDAGKNDNPAQSGAVGLLRLLLARAPGLVCLVTSRMALRVGGEHEFPLPPLGLPAVTSAACSLERLLAIPSVALYVDRARAVRPDFALSPQNAPAVAALCRRLEGMPLAIEMAAAWVKTMPPSKMLEHLEQQLNSLVSRRRNLPPRHQSLRATIEWSYDLLSPKLQAFFIQLGVFRGGWTLEAAEAVCGNEALYALAELQEHSLIVEVQPQEAADERQTQEQAQALAENQENQENQDEEQAESRYRMLEPLREFALEKLAETEQAEALHCQHAAYFMERAEQILPQFDGPLQAQTADWFRAEYDNLRAALTWLRTEGSTEERTNGSGTDGTKRLAAFDDTAASAADALLPLLAHRADMSVHRAEQEVNLALALHRFLELAGRYRESTDMLLQTFERTSSLGATPPRAQIVLQLGTMFWYRGNYSTAQQWHTTALDLLTEMGDKTQMGTALNNLANTTYYQGKFAEARQYYEQALAIGRETDQKRMIAVTLNNLGLVASYDGDYPGAQRYFDESLCLRRQMGDRRMILNVQHNLAEMYVEQGKYEQAETLLTQVLAEAYKDGNIRQIAYAQHARGGMRITQERYEEAALSLRESLLLRQEVGEQWGVALTLETFGLLALSCQEPERAVRLHGAAQNTLDQIGGAYPPHSQQEIRTRLQTLRDLLGNAKYQRCWEEGRLLATQQAIDLALS